MVSPKVSCSRLQIKHLAVSVLLLLSVVISASGCAKSTKKTASAKPVATKPAVSEPAYDTADEDFSDPNYESKHFRLPASKDRAHYGGPSVDIETTGWTPRKGAPTYEDFRVRLTRVLPSPQVRIDSHPQAPAFKSRLQRGADRGANFADYFTVLTWGCGPYCQTIAIVNQRTGSVYFAPFSSSVGVGYRRNSTLLVVNPKENLDRAKGVFTSTLESTRYYRWDGRDLVLIYPRQ